MLPVSTNLVEFNMANKVTMCEVTLVTRASKLEKFTLFDIFDRYIGIFDRYIGYNIILVRSWIYFMKVFSLTYHQVIKFPTPNGV